ncbi:MAG: AMP-binding protein [Acidimicrobiales bacterium]
MPTVADLVVARAGDHRRGLVTEGATWTWDAVVAEALARAALFESLSDEGPLHIGVLLENVPEYVFLLAGAALAGAVIVGINPTRRGAELERDIRHTDCRLVITERSQQGLLGGLDVGPVLVADQPDYEDQVRAHRGAALPTKPPSADALLLLLFTSGSTGAPKAVRMSQGRAARTAAASAAAFSRNDVLYCSMPLFHGNALLTNLLPGMTAGARIVLRRRFSASEFLPDIQRHECTFFNYVGRALSYIVAATPPEADHTNRLKWALGSEASPRDIAEFTRRFRCSIFEGYGSSENAVILQPGPGMPAAAMGRPGAGVDVEIVDPATGAPCPPAEFGPAGELRNAGEATGEIVGRKSAGGFEGYYNNPAADAERIRGDAYWTGDLGYRDADGWIYFAGRSGDWLRVDGENFSAAPVERILARCPAVSGVAVYGVPDPVTGDQVMAALEPIVGQLTPEDLTRFIADQPDLGTKWAPAFVRIVASLPVTGTGKIDKQPLRAERWDTTDPVWVRDVHGYRPMTRADIVDLRDRFAAHGRSAQIESR